MLEKLSRGNSTTDIRKWTDFLEKLSHPTQNATIAMVGKKDYLDNCYKSVQEALFHAAITANTASLSIKKIDAETLENASDISDYFNDIDGIVVPGNYGQRGFLGLLSTVRFAREHKIPFLGIDLGMQLMAIDTARYLCGWEDADTTEFMQNCAHPVISLPEEQTLPSEGIIKLGANPVTIYENTKLYSIYNSTQIVERHRSKYTFDRRYPKAMQEHGLVTSAVATSDNQTEAFESIGHPWGIGVQYHPEFISQPSKPHPLFTSFIQASLQKKEAE